ncbi:MAG: outer membrane lipoprotein carrier protein LolA [Rhodospirillaceae bacterium]
MRLIILFLALAVALTPAGSVTAADGVSGPSRTISASHTLHGAFIQERRLQGFRAPLRSEGRFMLAPGRGLIWRSEKPFAVTTIITATGLVQESGGSETLRLPAARLPFLAKLYDMLGGALAGDWHALERDFTVARQGDDTAWQVDLQPQVAADPVAMPIQAIRIVGGRFVDRVEIVKDGGDADVLTFTDQTLSDALPTPEEAALLAGADR